LIRVRNTSQRVTTNRGAVAVAEIFGITNCGAGPGFGPTAKVNAPCTGCPSTEIARQMTRYQPSASCGCNGTTRVSGLPGARRIGPVVSFLAAASVTEMSAKRGSTASSKVNARSEEHTSELQ